MVDLDVLRSREEQDGRSSIRKHISYAKLQTACVCNYLNACKLYHTRDPYSSGDAIASLCCCSPTQGLL